MKIDECTPEDVHTVGGGEFPPCALKQAYKWLILHSILNSNNMKKKNYTISESSNFLYGLCAM